MQGYFNENLSDSSFEAVHVLKRNATDIPLGNAGDLSTITYVRLLTLESMCLFLIDIIINYCLLCYDFLTLLT